MSTLPPGWANIRLRDVCRVEYGKGLSAAERSVGGSIPVVGSAGVVGQHSSALVPGPVIVVGRKGHAGAVYLLGSDCWPIDTTYFVRIPSVFEPKFLALQLTHSDLSSLDSSTAVPSLRRPDLEAWRLVVAPIAEQRRIVGAIEEQFSRLDAADSFLARSRRKASQLRSTALATITPVITEWTTLGEVAEIVGGVTKDSKRQSDPAFVEVPYLRVANVQRGYLDLREITTIRVPPGKAKQLRLEPGDILFNEGGDRDKLGRGWVWQGEIEECIHQNHVFRARLLTRDFDPRFVSMHGNTFGQRWFERMGKQTTNLASINLKTLKAFPVPAIRVDEQRRIVEEVERQLTLLDSLTTAIDRTITRSQYLRRAILERAFSGRLVPQDPGDESASQLLKRIDHESKKATNAKRERHTAPVR